MGHLVNRDGILVDPAKIEAVMQWEFLRSPSGIHSFLGPACYYRRFIRDFSKITVPLTRLTRKDTTFCWGPEQLAMFDTLWQNLYEASVFTLPKGVEDFVVYCDTLIMDLGTLLMKKGHVISYALR